ncbi:MAG TPA: DNA-binding transcriptional regulator [Opitutaceae bacterium]|nr:DNA-binding transcriptional regulator [Opitutaceae bacterium]
MPVAIDRDSAFVPLRASRGEILIGADLPQLRLVAIGHYNLMTRATQRSSRKVLVAASMAPVNCIRGLARYAREHDWHLVLDMMFTGVVPREWRGDGVLAVLPLQQDILSALQSLGRPCVLCGDGDPSLDFPRVEPDNASIGRLAAVHLIERGYRNFAWAPFANDIANRERLGGFQDRLATDGCLCRVLPPAHTRIGPYWQENWTEYRKTLVDEIRRLPRPTAIFAANDSVAANIVDACLDAGAEIPEEIAVIGVGDSIACETSPVPLSSVDIDLESIGYRAAALLDNILEGSCLSTEPVRILPKAIVTRVSTNVVAATDPRIARALTFIAENFPNNMLTVGEIADAVGMSRRNLERGFRQETGCSIHEYIVKVRMREASRLLQAHPRAKSSEIAALIGLSGASTFFRTFRRYYGMSPQAHRGLRSTAA